MPLRGCEGRTMLADRVLAGTCCRPRSVICLHSPSKKFYVSSQNLYASLNSKCIDSSERVVVRPEVRPRHQRVRSAGQQGFRIRSRQVRKSKRAEGQPKQWTTWQTGLIARRSKDQQQNSTPTAESPDGHGLFVLLPSWLSGLCSASISRRNRR